MLPSLHRLSQPCKWLNKPVGDSFRISWAEFSHLRSLLPPNIGPKGALQLGSDFRSETGGRPTHPSLLALHSHVLFSDVFLDVIPSEIEGCNTQDFKALKLASELMTVSKIYTCKLVIQHQHPKDSDLFCPSTKTQVMLP